jgi:hypothetical protein
LEAAVPAALTLARVVVPALTSRMKTSRALLVSSPGSRLAVSTGTPVEKATRSPSAEIDVSSCVTETELPF